MLGMDGLFGGILGYMGAEQQGDDARQNSAHAQNFSAQQTADQMQFQERMSNSAWQRGTADMKAAGLNPMLAYSQGGASSPSGASAAGIAAPSFNKLGAAVQGATSAAQIRNVDADTRLKEADAAVKEDQVIDRDAPDDQKSQDGFRLPKTFEMRLRAAQGNEAWFRAQNAMRQSDLTDEQTKHVKQQIINAITTNTIDNLNIPRLINEAEAEKSSFKKYVSPFLNDTGKIVNSAGTIAARGQGLRTQQYIIHGK